MPGTLENVEDAYPLTPVQEGMLYHTLSSEDRGVYLEQFSCIIEGSLDPDHFRAAWKQVYARHPALRTIFLWEDLDQPLQVVRREVDLPWQSEDWRSDPSAGQHERLAGFLQQDRDAGFDPSRTPLARFFLARVADDRWRFVWTFHHACVDGWSLGIILKQVLQAATDNPAALPEPPPFSEYVRWLQAQDSTKAEHHWRTVLRSFEEPSLPDLHPRPENAPGRIERHEHHLSPELWERIQGKARARKLTPNTVLHGAWALLLSRFSGRGDVVFGSTLSGRASQLPRIDSMVGCFLNTLPLRLQVDSESPLDPWLASLQRQHLELREFEYSDLTCVQRWSELPAHTPLFESIVVFENLDALPTGGEGIPFRLHEIELHEESNYPLALQLLPESGGLCLIFNYAPQRFSADAVDLMARYYDCILAGMVSRENPSLAEISALPREAQSQIENWSHGPSLEAEPILVPDLFARQRKDRAESVAVIHHDTQLTYDDLGREVARVASALATAGVSPGDRVGLCVERSPEMIIGIFGILMAGAAYVPLDPSYPTARLAYMLEDSHARFLLSRDGLQPDLECAQRFNFEDLASPDAGFLPPTPNLHDPAYVIYTSGSTGKPKGVGVTHGNLASSLAARTDYYHNAPEAFLLLSSFSFDSSVAGIFWTLCSGGTLILPGDGEEQDLDILADLISRHEGTHTLCLPSLYALLLEFAPAGKLRSLKVAIVAGEQCPPAVCRRHHATLPGCAFHNEYGPTEATVWCTAWKSEAGNPPDEIPIGRPIPGAEIHLLGPGLQPVPPGVPGELCVAGPGVVPGYLGRPDETDERFVSLPALSAPRLYRTGDLACWDSNGDLLFLGRIDEQVKVRGHRVELSEIESALTQHPEVSEGAAVLSYPSLPDDPASLAAALEELGPPEAERILSEITS